MQHMGGYIIINFPVASYRAKKGKRDISRKACLRKLVAMNPNRNSSMKASLVLVAISYLLYTIYQAITTTVFVTHFPTVIVVLPKFITSSQPSLQLGLFLFQEIAGSVGSYLRLTSAILAVSCVVLYFRNDYRYIGKFRQVLLLESLYFILLLPAAANHLIGSTISTSVFLNLYTGVSTLLQAVLIFPPLFILSRKLKNLQKLPQIKKWVCIAAPLYVFGFWIRHGLLWVYALSSSAPMQAGFFETVGLTDSLVMLLIAANVTTAICLIFLRKQKLYVKLVGTAIILFGLYFVIYDLVSIWVPVYRAFLPLTDFWMATLPILGIAILLSHGKKGLQVD